MYIMEVIQNRKQLGKITYSDFFSYKNMWLYGVFFGKTVRPHVFTGFAACFFT